MDADGCRGLIRCESKVVYASIVPYRPRIAMNATTTNVLTRWAVLLTGAGAVAEAAAASQPMSYSVPRYRSMIEDCCGAGVASGVARGSHRQAGQMNVSASSCVSQ